MSNLPRSHERQLADGKIRHFPTFSDFAERLVEQGEISSIDELTAERVDLFSDLFFDWVFNGQTSCEFAANLARDHDAASWLSAVVVSIEDVDDTINSFLDAASESAEAVNLIFPNITTVEEIAFFINQLCENKRWWWEEIAWTDPRSPKRLLVGLRWLLPSQTSMNWVLGFAPIETMPFTRRILGAPFIALSMRIKDPHDERPFEKGTHLCDMPDLLSSDAEHETYRIATGVKRERLLADDPDCAAKAKVTFVLPTAVRDSLTSPGRK